MNTPYRYLTIQHEEHLVNGTFPDVRPGEAVLRSHFHPSLQGGLRSTTVSEEIDVQPQALGVGLSKDVAAIAPHYSLPPSSVNSMFPTAGHCALAKTLPHVVLKDPHFPWDWAARTDSITPQGDEQKARIPWVALITFSTEELQPGPTTLESITKFPDVKANENLAFSFPVARINDMKSEMGDKGNLTNLMMSPHANETKDNTTAICISKDLFGQLFADEKGICHVDQFRYLSHVRKVATAGMVSSVEGESGLYSIVVSHRTGGPLDTSAPVNMFAHLVSIENIESLDMAKVNPRVLMTSLYSWSYTSLPAGTSNEATALRNLGKSGIQPLRSTPTQGSSQRNRTEIPTEIQDVIVKRQQDGYTLVRHRAVTGEQTAAICRGPLVPTPVMHNIKPQSNFGSDLQILDRDLSLMDISYDSAWQLGKAMGMGDAAFTAALSRIRALIRTEAVDKAKRGVDRHLGTNKTREDSEKGPSYNHYEVPNNTDFQQVYNWVLDKLYLAHIPVHSLIPDPSSLPPESLRFFYVDENWTQVMVDGALSLANNWASEPGRDHSRSILKAGINARLATPHEKLGYCQQMPKYGFLLRSQVLVQFPDLRVEVTFAKPKASSQYGSKPKASILVQRMLNSDIMLCLFDRTPPALESVEFTLPPHQLTFAVGEDITPLELKVAFRKTVATKTTSIEWPSKQDAIAREIFSALTCPVFDRPSRTLRATEYARRVFKHLRSTEKETSTFFNETGPTSALLALQLNESIHTLKVSLEPEDNPKKN